MSTRERAWGVPLSVFAVAALVYGLVAGERLLSPSPEDHYVRLAQAWLDGRLDLGPDAPGTNDWACFDTVDKGPCPRGSYAFAEEPSQRYRWFVSFPPLPAVILLPLVALFGSGVLDRLLWCLVAALGPCFLFLVLQSMRESGESKRSLRENLLLTGLFAFGSVYFFAAVQGSVWFAAHVVAVPLICLYVLFGYRARRPALAGWSLGLAFLCRPSTLLLAPFLLLEARRAGRRAGGDRASWPRELLAFAVPLAALVAAAMWHNTVRFSDPLEFGHRFLQIRWRDRIETWGLFDVHYLGRNLKVFLLSLPWLYAQSPFVRITRHGLALWFTTPNLLWTLWPKQLTPTILSLWAAVVPTAICTLLYQNSGWVQFGYRFSLDYLPLLFAILALTKRRFGWLFLALALFSVIVNTFGAVTFDRFPQFYDTDPTQQVIFKPD